MQVLILGTSEYGLFLFIVHFVFYFDQIRSDQVSPKPWRNELCIRSLESIVSIDQVSPLYFTNENHVFLVSDMIRVTPKGSTNNLCYRLKLENEIVITMNFLGRAWLFQSHAWYKVCRPVSVH